MPTETHKIRVLWSSKVDHRFNSFAVGQVFKLTGVSVVCGCDDGVVRIYEVPHSVHRDKTNALQMVTSLETKGGAIQNVSIWDVTKFYANDVIVVDNKGTATVFCNEQILARKAVSEHCVHCLQIQQDPLGNMAIVTSDGEGLISAFSPYTDLWNLRLTDLRQLKGLSSTPIVKCLLSVDICDSSGQTSNYLLATDNHRHLFFIQQGSVVLVLNTPAVINAMASGKFIDEHQLENVPADTGISCKSTQIVLGSETGALYLVSNFEVYQDEIANLQLPLTKLKVLPSTDPQKVDSLLCAGNFNALAVVRDGKEYARHTTPSWISSLDAADIDEDGQLEVVVGCLDNSVHALKVSVT